MSKIISHPMYEKWEVKPSIDPEVNANLDHNKAGSHAEKDYKFEKVKKLAEATEMHDKNAALHNANSHQSNVRYYKTADAVIEEEKPEEETE